MHEESLRTREFNRILDRYLATGTMAAEEYENLNATQKTVIQCIKRAFERASKQ